jgi:FkbM family methyltransferase
LSADTPIGRFLCRGGTTDFEIINPNYEAALVRALRNRLASLSGRPAVFVDVGAHIGKYSILAGRILRSSGTVVAIEPDPANFEALTRNVQLNDLSNVLVLNVGCWSYDGMGILHRQVGDLGGHSFVDETLGEDIRVPIRTLDGLLSEQGLDHVDIMKLDVQRAEAEVLRGARATLETNHDSCIFFEETAGVSAAGSIRFLKDLDFEVKRLDDFNYVALRST